MIKVDSLEQNYDKDNKPEYKCMECNKTVWSLTIMVLGKESDTFEWCDSCAMKLAALIKVATLGTI